MKFAVGYQLSEGDEESFVDLVRDYRDHIAEVYFPWGGLPSGRAALNVRRGYTDWSAQARLEDDLRAIRAMGINLDLLFNANCYGGRALSQSLANEVRSVLDHLGEVVGGVQVVTTTSLAVAYTVKQHVSGVAVRASVNMRIGTTQAMGFVSDLFNGFYVQRDYNRQLAHVRLLKAWADAHGKELLMLANSGCLRFCPGQVFHDNLVAHDQEIDEAQNIPDWSAHVCWTLFKRREQWPALLQATWIRPEDLWHYDDLFPVVKLATRMHSRPRLVLEAYTRRRYHGNLLELFEPGHARLWAPHLIENDRFPADWFDHTSTCAYRCDTCGYCTRVLEQTLRFYGAPTPEETAAT